MKWLGGCVVGIVAVLTAPAHAQAPTERPAPASDRPTYAPAGSKASAATELVFDRVVETVTEAQLDGGQPFEARRLPATFQAPFPDLPKEFCTATLVGPRAILTAAHCVDLELPDGTFTMRKIGVRITRDGPVIRSRSCALPAAYIDGDYAHPSPRNAHDYALCELEATAPVRAEVISLDAGRSADGASLMLAGYGCTYAQLPGGGLAERPAKGLLVGTSRRSGSASGWITAPGQVGTTRASLCSGDSGGAVFTGADPAQTASDRGWAVSAVASGVMKYDGGRIVSYLSPLSVPEFRTFIDGWRYSGSPRRLNRDRLLCGLDIGDAPSACRPQ